MVVVKIHAECTVCGRLQEFLDGETVSMTLDDGGGLICPTCFEWRCVTETRLRAVSLLRLSLRRLLAVSS